MTLRPRSFPVPLLSPFHFARHADFLSFPFSLSDAPFESQVCHNTSTARDQNSQPSFAQLAPECWLRRPAEWQHRSTG